MEIEPSSESSAAMATPAQSVSWGGVAAVPSSTFAHDSSLAYAFGQQQQTQFAAFQSPGGGHGDPAAMASSTPVRVRHPPSQPPHGTAISHPPGQQRPFHSRPFQMTHQSGLAGTPLQQQLFELDPFHTPSPAKGAGVFRPPSVVGTDLTAGITPLPATPVRRPAAKRQCPFDDTTPLQMKTAVWDRPSPAATHASTLHRLMTAQRGHPQPADADGDEEEDDDLAAMEGAAAERCSICNSQQPSEPCSFCGKSSCGSCTRECASCQETFCSYCSTTNYDLRYDRNFCLECNEEESKESSSPQSVMYSPAKRQVQLVRTGGASSMPSSATSSATRTLFAFATR